jgi:4-hydroxybenzoate polyprenyltransferase
MQRNKHKSNQGCESNPTQKSTIKKVLVVDLDGTLLKTDMLVESLNQFVASHPLQCFHLVTWLCSGRAYLKARLAESIDIDVSSLPYNDQVIEWLKTQKSLGRKIVLATATHQIIANRIALHLGLFEEVFATNDKINLKSEVKRDLLVEKYGVGGFEYLGNDWADLPVWAFSHGAYLVSPKASLIRQVKKTLPVYHIFDDGNRNSLLIFFKALRAHQWIKNLLVFVPLLAAHKYGSVESLIYSVVAFICFSSTASSVYLLNDLIDLNNDRHHPQKKYRPFASGNLNLIYGWILIPCLILNAILISRAFLPDSFTGVLFIYFGFTFAYSLFLKQIVMLDVLVLAGLYTLRLVAGAEAVLVTMSFWLLTFSMFIFLSLALIKRFGELKNIKPNSSEASLLGRDYSLDDLELVSSAGIGAGYISVLVMALYIQDVETKNLYQNPQFIWLAIPLLLYWISRMWLIAHRGKMEDDPIVFSLSDWPSLILGALLVIVFALAKFV